MAKQDTNKAAKKRLKKLNRLKRLLDDVNEQLSILNALTDKGTK
jgi:hypothetical protein